MHSGTCSDSLNYRDSDYDNEGSSNDYDGNVMVTITEDEMRRCDQWDSEDHESLTLALIFLDWTGDIDYHTIAYSHTF